MFQLWRDRRRVWNSLARPARASNATQKGLVETAHVEVSLFPAAAC